jgi:transcriptional regulator with PAS, ATPase and Fis domain
MSTVRLTLVADDQGLADSVAIQLRDKFGEAVLRSDFASIREIVGPDAESVVLLASGSAADARQVAALVREFRLMQWHITVLVVETEAACRGHDLVALDPYVGGRYRWPTAVAGLLRQVHRLAARGNGVHRPSQTTLEEDIARRLRAQTHCLLPLAKPLALAACHDVPVLVTGETGTGKSYLARLIHECSARRDQSLMVVPCGALVSSLVESELFGHVKGAFTGADNNKVGKFEAVGQGSLLLDEVDALGLEQQAKLLRVIETGQYEPVGSNRTQTCVARIMAASNWDLEEAVAEGKFRRDLYYRLNVLSLYLPPLRERLQDIATLAQQMVARFNTKFGKELLDIHPQTMAALKEFSWPGNIRQLENVMQHAVLLSTGPQLLVEHLPRVIQEGTPGSAKVKAVPIRSLSGRRQKAEWSIIHKALAEANNNRTRAAAALGISRVALYKKLKRYSLSEKSSYNGLRHTIPVAPRRREALGAHDQIGLPEEAG